MTTRRATMTIALAALLAAPTLAAAAPGGVKGTVTAAAREHEALADAVVTLDGPSAPADPAARHAVIDQRGDAFVPRVLVVPVGTTVDFPNHDTHLHNVFAMSKTKTFDLGMYDAGESRSVLFDQVGRVPIRCNVHPKMEAMVVVHSNAYAAVSGADGSYTIPGVLPGSYTARIWHQGHRERSVPVTVKDGAITALDVRLEAAH
jgi:plastocyanin